MNYKGRGKICLTATCFMSGSSTVFFNIWRWDYFLRKDFFFPLFRIIFKFSSRGILFFKSVFETFTSRSFTYSYFRFHSNSFLRHVTKMLIAFESRCFHIWVTFPSRCCQRECAWNRLKDLLQRSLVLAYLYLTLIQLAFII